MSSGCDTIKKLIEEYTTKKDESEKLIKEYTTKIE